MDRTILCLSCLNGQFKAAVFDRGSAAGGWERPDPVDNFGSVAAVVKEAAEKTRYVGHQVSMVLAHPRLNDQIVEAPPVKGWTLRRFLQRRAQRLKTFDGEAAWSYQPAMPTKASGALLLHLFPKPLLDQLAAGCEEADLQLVRLLPATAVLASQLTELPLEKDEVAMLAAETGSTTTVVIGRRDGRICLDRVLRSTWNTEPDRLAVDLARTIGFAEQQAGVTVTSVWLFGAGAQGCLPELRSRLKLPVSPSPVEHRPLYWAEQAAKLPVEDDGDLVSLEAREAPQRRRLLTVTGALLLILFLASLATAGFTELLRRTGLQTIEKLNAEIARQCQLRTEWRQRHAELTRKKELVRIVSEEKLPPVPGWLLGCLSEAPDNLLLTELRVTRTNDLWSVRLAGAAQPTANALPAAGFQKAFADLTNSLATGPFHLKITRSALRDGSESVERTPADASLQPIGAAEGEKQHTFVLEGVIR
jgi:hypothetical protein